jgi:hypothetical protein
MYSGTEATEFSILLPVFAPLSGTRAKADRKIAKRLDAMSIPFGAIVHEAIRVGSAGGREMLLVRFSRRARDGSYAGEEIEAVSEERACRLVTAALERGEGSFWGSWFGLREPAWMTPTLLRKHDKNDPPVFLGHKNRQLAKTD